MDSEIYLPRRMNAYDDCHAEHDSCHMPSGGWCAKISVMKPSRLEPGLLNIFRLFLVVQLIFMLINLHVHSARGYLEGNVGFAYVFVVSGSLGLLGY